MDVNFLKLMTALIPNVFLIFSLKHLKSTSQAAVMLSPSDLARVYIGESLEVTCSVTGIILEWSFPHVGEPQALRLRTKAIIAEGPAEAQTDQLIDNSTTYQFTRTSAEGSPVSSRLIISTVSNGHNGTTLTCSDVTTETASTTIVIIDNYREIEVICEVPSANTTHDNRLKMINYSEPIAVVGSTITFTCLPGMEPNSATCMENGEWKPQLSCASMITESHVILQDSANTSTVTVLASTFGAIFFVILIIFVAFILVAYSIRRAKCTRNMCSTSRDQNNSESKVTAAAGYLVYADIGPSSFSNQQPRRQLHIPPIDDAPIEYAQIKHNCGQRVETSSMRKQPLSKKPNTTENKSDTNSPELNVTLDNLLIQLRPQLTPVWYKFGEAAGIEKGVLDDFAKQCTPEDCVMEMLDYWLRNQADQPTWNDIAKILKIIHFSQLALEIEKVYVTGKLPVEVDMNHWIHAQPQVKREDPSNKGPVATESAPPRIPPKMNESAIHLGPNAVPALPPKPKNY